MAGATTPTITSRFEQIHAAYRHVFINAGFMEVEHARLMNILTNLALSDDEIDHLLLGHPRSSEMVRSFCESSVHRSGSGFRSVTAAAG
jgi:hypothetical protein